MSQVANDVHAAQSTCIDSAAHLAEVCDTAAETALLVTSVCSNSKSSKKSRIPVCMQFNSEATSIAFLHHITNCTQRQSSAAVPSTDTATATGELVTVNLDGSQVWALPLDDVKSFDYGRWGRLLVSTSRGLYEAEVPRHSMQKLKPPATGASWLQPCATLRMILHVQ